MNSRRFESYLHGLGFVQVGPHCVDDVDVVHLVAADAVGLHQLRRVLDHSQGNVVQRLVLEGKSLCSVKITLEKLVSAEALLNPQK